MGLELFATEHPDLSDNSDKSDKSDNLRWTYVRKIFYNDSTTTVDVSMVVEDEHSVDEVTSDEDWTYNS